jgi:hypothetical protein
MRPSFPHFSTRGMYKVYKGLVRLGADHFPPTNHESWNCCNAAGVGILPVTVYRFLESPLGQCLFRHPAIKANCPGDLFQDRSIGDVPSISEVRLKYSLVKLVPFAQCFSPFPKFLRPAAIVGSRAPTPGKSQLGSDFLQTPHGRGEIYVSPPEKLFEAQALFRCFRVKGEGNPPDPYLVLFL